MCFVAEYSWNNHTPSFANALFIHEETLCRTHAETRNLNLHILEKQKIKRGSTKSSKFLNSRSE